MDTRPNLRPESVSTNPGLGLQRVSGSLRLQNLG